MIKKCLCLVLLLHVILVIPAHAASSTPAPEMLLANVYKAGIDVSQYLVSEKLDGVRAQWDGHKLLFRSGGIVPAPSWFTANFPPVPLDGELWIARDQFDMVSGTVRKIIPVDADWKRVHYMIFELPGAAGNFTERSQQINKLVLQSAAPWLQAVAQTRGVDHNSLMRRLDDVMKLGGEGLMLHLADAPYLSGRHDVLLKLKHWLDSEAVLIGYMPGKGKYRGMTGALIMQMPNGKRFRIGIGLSDTLRRQPPSIGTRITYRYQQLTKAGLPRFPHYLRIREEL